MNFKPIGRRVYAVLNQVEERQTAGGLYISAKHSELTRIAEIVAIGAECEKPINVGDKVLVTFHAGVVIDATGDNLATNDCHRILSEDEILAVLE